MLGRAEIRKLEQKMIVASESDDLLQSRRVPQGGERIPCGQRVEEIDHDAVQDLDALGAAGFSAILAKLRKNKISTRPSDDKCYQILRYVVDNFFVLVKGSRKYSSLGLACLPRFLRLACIPEDQLQFDQDAAFMAALLQVRLKLPALLQFVQNKSAWRKFYAVLQGTTDRAGKAETTALVYPRGRLRCESSPDFVLLRRDFLRAGAALIAGQNFAGKISEQKPSTKLFYSLSHIESAVTERATVVVADTIGLRRDCFPSAGASSSAVPPQAASDAFVHTLLYDEICCPPPRNSHATPEELVSQISEKLNKAESVTTWKGCVLRKRKPLVLELYQCPTAEEGKDYSVNTTPPFSIHGSKQTLPRALLWAIGNDKKLLIDDDDGAAIRALSGTVLADGPHDLGVFCNEHAIHLQELDIAEQAPPARGILLDDDGRCLGIKDGCILDPDLATMKFSMHDAAFQHIRQQRSLRIFEIIAGSPGPAMISKIRGIMAG